jgi:hypothetical protein
MTNFIDELIDGVSRHIKKIKGMKPTEIKMVIAELMKESAVWDSLASGTKKYLKDAHDDGGDRYLKGAIPHLVKALPHRLGFIASVIKEEFSIGDPGFDDIVSGKRSFDDLNANELIRFINDFLGNSSLSKFLNASVLSNHKRTAQTWVDTYNRRKTKKGEADAAAYILGKKKQIHNLFVKSIFPNLVGGIARAS